MKIKIAITVGVIVGLIAGAYFAFSGEQAPKEKEPAQTEPTYPQVETIGTSVEGRAIKAYTYGNGDTHLLFVGGVHGGYEWNSTILAENAIDYFTADPNRVPDDITVTIIPALNPDGIARVFGTSTDLAAADALPTEETTEGRFNARDVDVNRNFDCKWESSAVWRGNDVDAGTSAFSEPESAALRDFVAAHNITAAVMWHSAADAVFASQCEDGILPETLTIMNTYADAADYPTQKSFDYYEVTGAAADWFARLGIPALSVELATHETVGWDQNRRGMEALIDHYSNRTQIGN